MKKGQKTQKWILNVFFLAIFLFVFYLFFKILLPFVTPFILATLLALIFYPLYKKLVKLLKGKERVAAVLMCIFVIFLVVIPLGFFLTLLSKEAYDYYQDTKEKIDSGYYQNLINDNLQLVKKTNERLKGFGITIDFEKQRDNLLNTAKSIGFSIYNQAGDLAGNVFQAVFYFVTIIFVFYYFLKDKKKISQALMDLSPLPDNIEIKLARRVTVVGKAVIFGNMITAGIQGILGGLGFLFFGLGNAVFWGTMIGVASLIPSLGVFIIAIPASLIFFIQGKFWLGIGFLVYMLLIVGSIDNVLKPKLIESKIKLHPLFVFTGVLGGLLSFGPLGIIYGPLIVALFVAFIDIYKEHFRDKALE